VVGGLQQIGQPAEADLYLVPGPAPARLESQPAQIFGHILPVFVFRHFLQILQAVVEGKAQFFDVGYAFVDHERFGAVTVHPQKREDQLITAAQVSGQPVGKDAV